MSEILAYIFKDGFFHRLHPLTKIAFIFAISAVCIVATNIEFLLGLVLALLVISYMSNLYTEVVQQSRLIVMMSVIFVVITLLTMPGGDLIAYLIPAGSPVFPESIPLTWGALGIGIILSLRFMILIYAFQLFLISTQPRDLVHTMEKLKIPLDYTLMFIIALRFIPSLQIEGNRIHEAQQARGYNPGTGIIGKIRSVAPIVIPLVSNALSRANVLGLTIDIRGYRTAKRTRLREFPFQSRDYLVMAVLVAGTLIFTLATISQVIE